MPRTGGAATWPADLDAQLAAFARGEHPRPQTLLGAHPLSSDAPVDDASALADGGGVRFAVWAPHARAVEVVGDWNGWQHGERLHPVADRRAQGGGWEGVWGGVAPQARIGALYKFRITDAHGHVLPDKADPCARSAELRPGTASRIEPPLDAVLPRLALGAARAAANAREAPVSIYEVHLGSWMRHPDGRFHDWDDLAERLPRYAADLGFTHLELLPIGEFPFDPSWGYQSLGLFAPTARHGSAAGLRRFVARCHAEGIGVLLDWVPAHFPRDGHGLARFDGTALYEYADPRLAEHADWGTLVYDYARPAVTGLLSASALHWCERFGVDGVRVDAVASMLYRDYSRGEGGWIANEWGGRENFEAIAWLKRMNELLGREAPGAITVAEESTAFPRVSQPTWDGGLGFHFKWNMGWMNDTLRYMAEEPVHRRWHHGRLTFGLLYAWSENFVLPLSHDEVVHGKRSLLGRMPGDAWQRFANLRAYYGFMWGHPGKKLLFMGQEFAQPDEWNEAGELPWHLLQHAPHRGVQRLVGDLNRLMRASPSLHLRDAMPEGFAWRVVDDAEQSVVAWERLAPLPDGSTERMLVVSNFTPVPRAGYRIGLPHDEALQWRVALDTDAVAYGGSGWRTGQRAACSDAVAAHGHPRSLAVDLPPLATLFLRAEPRLIDP